jgi:N-acetylneuraminic acid mutarotase
MIDPKECEITELPPMKTAKRRLRLLYHEKFVYAIGGVREKTVKEQNFRGTRLDYSNSFERYSLENSSWEDLEDLPRGVEYPGCFVLNNSLYVTGGSYISGQDPLIVDSVQIFDLATETWISHSLELPISLYTHMCAQLEDDRVIIFGGADEEDDNNYECYIFDGNSFKQVCSLPENSATAFPYYSVVFNNEVITYNDENDIFTYSVSSDSWYTTSLTIESVT